MVRKVCWTDRQTDRQTDRRTDGLNHSYSCLVAAKNNRAPLLCCLKLCASFCRHMWIQTGVTVRKWLNGVMTLWPWPLTLTFCMDVTSVNCNNSWKCQDDTMRGTLSKRCDALTDRQTDRNKCSWSCLVAAKKVWQTDKWTDRQTDITIHRSAWSQLKILWVLTADKEMDRKTQMKMTTSHGMRDTWKLVGTY